MGERFGEYELIKKIATGGMAEIYLARISGLEGFSRRVVVKRMLPQLAVRHDFVEMFLDEARLAANLVHPNIVQVFNLGQVDGAYFMAMELIDGPHLGALFAHSLRQRRPLPVELCVYIMARGADGLHYAHEQRDPATGLPLNIVHRDISPQNVLVSRHGDVKVTDFGVAKAETQQSKTRTGIIKGKVSYMSPEQCLGEPVDRRTDVFALGVVLYELLTRRRLYREKSDLLIMQRITGEVLKPPSSLNPAVDPELDRIAGVALSKSREDRYRSAADLSEALDVWLATQGHADCRAQLQRWMEAHADSLGIGVSEVSEEASGTGTPAWEKSSARDGSANVDDGEEGTVSTPALDPARDSLSGKHRVAPDDEIDVSTSRLDLLRQETTSAESSPVPTDTQVMRAPPGDIESELGSTAIHEVDLPSQLVASPKKRPMAAMIGGVAAVAIAFAVLVFAVGREGEGGDAVREEVVTVAPFSGEQPGAAGTEGGLAQDAGAAAVEPIAAVAVTPPVKEPPREPAPPVEETEELALVVETSPPGVLVTVDGEPQGKSPVDTKLALEPGKEVEVLALFKDQPPVTRKIRLEAGKRNELKLVAKVPASIVSEPSGAQVSVGGRSVGATPRQDLFLTPGTAVAISVEKSGYRRFSRQVVPKEGEPLEVKAVLERLPARSPPAQAPSYGALQVNSKPWGMVYVDGKRVGPTPVTVPKVRAGNRRVKIVNKDDGFGFTKTVTVDVKKNQQSSVGFVFEKKGESYELVRLVQ